jgi:hypothetical protein
VVADQPAEKLIKIGAKVVRHGRYVTFPMAEVAVSRQIFADILSLSPDCGRRPHRHDGPPLGPTRPAPVAHSVADQRVRISQLASASNGRVSGADP